MTYLAQLEPDDRIKEVKRLFRMVFSDAEGQIVLTTILEELHYFDQPTNEREEALRSFASHLVDMTCSTDNHALVAAMLRVPKE